MAEAHNFIQIPLPDLYFVFEWASKTLPGDMGTLTSATTSLAQ